MNTLTKEYAGRERIALLLLGIIAVILVYYLLVYKPIHAGITSARQESATLEDELTKLQGEVSSISTMQNEMKMVDANPDLKSRMPSYNAGKREVTFLNDTLSEADDFFVGFTEVTRDGNQIRRNYSLQFSCSNYGQAVKILKKLEGSEIRCLIGDMSVDAQEGTTVNKGGVNFACTATFYETMHGGTEDRELPKEENAQTGQTQ